LARGALLATKMGNRVGVLKIMFAKNFSIPAKFGIIKLRFKKPLSIFTISMTGKKFV
jgi:hypothetical protein